MTGVATMMVHSPRVSEHGTALGISYNQQQICLLAAFYPGNKAYNAQATIKVSGELEVACLEQAVSHVVARHEMLRTTIRLAHDGYRATVHAPFHFRIPLHDVSGLAALEQQQALVALRHGRHDQVFDLERLPLLSIDVLRLAANDWRLIQVEHHVVHDGWSFGRFWSEVQICYNALLAGRQPVLSALPAQYQQFVSWQRDRMEGEYGRTAIEFWAEYLDGVPELNLGSTPNGVNSLDGHNLEATVPAETFGRIREMARRLAVSPFVLMFSVYAQLLASKSGLADFCIGTSSNARVEEELEPMIGMVVNALPIRVNVGRSDPLARVVRGIQASLFRALRYSDVPLSLLVRRLKLTQKPGRNPVFQHCFSFHDSEVQRLRLGSAIAEITEEQNQTSKFDTNIVVIPPSATRGTTDARILWQCSRSAFSRAEADALVCDYQDLLARAIDEP